MDLATVGGTSGDGARSRPHRLLCAIGPLEWGMQQLAAVRWRLSVAVVVWQYGSLQPVRRRRFGRVLAHCTVVRWGAMGRLPAFFDGGGPRGHVYGVEAGSCGADGFYEAGGGMGRPLHQQIGFDAAWRVTHVSLLEASWHACHQQVLCMISHAQTSSHACHRQMLYGGFDRVVMLSLFLLYRRWCDGDRRRGNMGRLCLPISPTAISG